MKMFVRLSLPSIILIFLSCNSEQDLLSNDEISNNEKVFLFDLKSQEEEILIEKIENIKYESNNQIDQITSIEKVGKLYIVNYVKKDGSSGNVGINDLFYEDYLLNFLNVNDRTVIWCTGTCNCYLEGVIWGDEVWSQCSCNNCVMHVADDYPKQQQNQTIVNENKLDITELSKESFIKTFNKEPSNIKVTKISYDNYDSELVSTVFYEDDNGNKSTFMVIQYKNKNLRAIVVDCTGTCDCRERFFPLTGTIECTCSPCQMTITEK